MTFELLPWHVTDCVIVDVYCTCCHGPYGILYVHASCVVVVPSGCFAV